MTRILTYIKYELKVFLGNYSNMFWMMGFPLLLLTVFTVSFSDLRFDEFKFEKATVAYHEEAFMPLYFVEAPEELPDMEKLDRTSIENSLFKGKEMDKEQALKALKEDEIDAYVDEDLNLVIRKNGISQMVMDEVVVTTKQISSLNLPMEAYDFNRKYVENTGKKYSPIDIIFYSLFAMISLYGAYLSGTISNRLIARRQKVALRNITSPTPKVWQVMVSVISCFLWSIFMIVIMILYTEFALRQNFFSPDINNILIIFSAVFFGMAWGLFLGTVIEKESLQTTAIISSLLIMAGISGMFSDGIRIMLQRVSPSVVKFNPIAMISDEMIKVNMLENYSTLNTTVLLLTGYSIILIGISILYIRRKQA